MSYLSEHLGEVVHVGGAVRLGLEALQLEVVFGDVGRRLQQPVQLALLGPVCLEHDLKTQDNLIYYIKEGVLGPTATNRHLVS